MSRATAAALLVLALAGCGKKDEDQAKDKARHVVEVAKEKASEALDHAKHAAAAARDKIAAIDIDKKALDLYAQKAGVLDEIDAQIKTATEAVKATTDEAARRAAMFTLHKLIETRAYIAKRIDELKAAGTYVLRPSE